MILPVENRKDNNCSIVEILYKKGKSCPFFSAHNHLIITSAFHLQLTSLSNYLQNLLLLQPLPSAQHAFLHHRPHCSPSSRRQVSTALSIEKPFFLLTKAPDSSALAGNNCKCQVGDTQFDSLTEKCCNQINNGFDTYHGDQHHQVYPPLQ